MEERKNRIHVRSAVAVNGRQSAEALDLSEEGMYIFTSRTFIEGLTVNLEFDLDGESYDVRAKIKHSEDGVGFGVNFVDMDDNDARRLRDYVDSR